MKRLGPEDYDEDGGPLFARARTTDPGTSHAAAASVERLSRLRRLIHETLKARGPMIDYALIALLRGQGYRYTRSGIQTRRCELVEMGLVEDSGERHKTETNRWAIVWRAL